MQKRLSFKPKAAVKEFSDQERLKSEETIRRLNRKIEELQFSLDSASAKNVQLGEANKELLRKVQMAYDSSQALRQVSKLEVQVQQLTRVHLADAMALAEMQKRWEGSQRGHVDDTIRTLPNSRNSHG